MNLTGDKKVMHAGWKKLGEIGMVLKLLEVPESLLSELDEVIVSLYVPGPHHVVKVRKHDTDQYILDLIQKNKDTAARLLGRPLTADEDKALTPEGAPTRPR